MQLKNIFSFFFFFQSVLSTPKLLLRCPLATCPLVAISRPKEKRSCIQTDGTKGYQITYLRSGILVTCNTRRF